MQAVQEVIQTFRGYRGDKLDKALTLRDLSLAAQRGLMGGGSMDTGIIGGSTPALPVTGAYVIDPTPPPTPTGLAVNAAITSLFVSCDAPVYTQGHGHAVTVVYGAKWPTADLTQPTFSEAVELYRFQGTFSSYATDPATRWCIWIKWQSVDGFLSTDPAGGTNGVVATTGQDVALLLDALSGEITASELHTSLGTRIDLVDGPDTLPGSVAARVLTEATTRASQTGALFAQYTVKLDVDGKVSGYGLASTGPTGAGSTFEVRSNKFVIAAETGGAAGFVPFQVLTAPTVIDGVTLPAGAYATNAFIQNLQVTNAKIAALAVDDGKVANLSAAKLTAGSIAVGQYIQGTGYVAGSAGWRINGDGTAEFSSVVVRGTVYATAGSFTGDVYANNGWFRGAVNTGSYYGYAWPTDGGGGAHLSASGLLVGNANLGKYFQITSDGNVHAPNFSIINGNPYFNGSGVFSGGVYASYGSFTGSVSGSTFSTNSGKFTVDANGIMTADEANIQRRVVLQTGTIATGFQVPGTYTDTGGGTSSYPAGTVQVMPPNFPPLGVWIETDVYDDYLISTSKCQQFGVSFHAEGTTTYNGGTGSFNFAAEGVAEVARTYSVGGVDTVNDRRVYIRLDTIVCRNNSAFNYVYTPTFRWKLYKL
jgi:hypothetical protein